MFQPITRGTHEAAHGRILAVIAAAMMASAAASMVAAPALAHGGDSLRAAANEYRSEGFRDSKGHLIVAGGLDPVIGTSLLDDIATKRASQMVNQNELAHNMEYVKRRLVSSGVCWTSFGEIIAWERGYAEYSADRTMLQWMNSKAHRDIVMDGSYNAAGGAWRRADLDGAHFSVMVFARLCGADASNETVARLSLDQRYDPDRRMIFMAGKHTGYKLSADGEVLGRKTVTVESRVQRTAAGRAHANGKAWIKVSSGALAGHWVHETPSQFVRGMTQYRVYATDRSVTVAAGRYTGHKFDWLGRVTLSRSRTYSHSTQTKVEARSIINGRVYLRFSFGYLAGFWVPDTSSINFT
jgi:uncharacterized protein YkwD